MGIICRLHDDNQCRRCRSNTAGVLSSNPRTSSQLIIPFTACILFVHWRNSAYFTRDFSLEIIATTNKCLQPYEGLITILNLTSYQSLCNYITKGNILILSDYLKLNSGFGKYTIGRHICFLLLILNDSYLWGFHFLLHVGNS